VTKYRRKCITGSMLDRLREIVDQRCEDWGGELVEFNGETDHVHILARFRQTSTCRPAAG
jgi:putative transposase